MKTKIFNLIILDESGSMSPLRQVTIDGCNETINSIISSQRQYSATQDHYVSIYAFQGGSEIPSRYLLRDVAAAQVNHITPDNYCPWGNTPLYDAVGTTLADLRNRVKNEELAIGSVTIITDGQENSSTHFTGEQVASMIKVLTEMGWNFNFIGANIDAAATACKLNIDNAMQFEATQKGTAKMYENFNKGRMNFSKCINEELLACDDDSCSTEPVTERFKRAAKNFFGK
ncbi:MAG: VWA domain-containing protein [Muribaculaceae bacterium]|nr:VWA domain-containing protein [Muribaculaceae bacterium]